MAKHDDLDVLLDATEMMNPKQLDGATDQTVEKREGHDGRGSSRVSLLVKSAFGLVHPTGGEASQCKQIGVLTVIVDSAPFL